MSALLFVELMVCFFAVLGVYFVVCKLLRILSSRDHISLAIHASRYSNISDLDCTIKSAAFERDGDRHALMPTVLLFDSEDHIEQLMGEEYDLEIYVRYPKR